MPKQHTPGDYASYMYCRVRRIVRLLTRVPDSDGLARDPMWRVNMDGRKMLVRQSELRPIERPAPSHPPVQPIADPFGEEVAS